MVAYIYNTSTGETEAGGSQVQDQHGLHSRPLPSLPSKENKQEILVVLDWLYFEIHETSFFYVVKVVVKFIRTGT
jgi:hypothetical protein